MSRRTATFSACTMLLVLQNDLLSGLLMAPQSFGLFASRAESSCGLGLADAVNSALEAEAALRLQKLMQDTNKDASIDSWQGAQRSGKAMSFFALLISKRGCGDVDHQARLCCTFEGTQNRTHQGPFFRKERKNEEGKR